MELSWWPIPSFPKLASNNYNGWSIQMKTFLKEQEVWEAMEVGYEMMPVSAVTEKAQRKARVRDKKALSFLQTNIDQANLDQILGIKDARTAWEFLKKAHQHADEDEDESNEDDEFEDALSESRLQLRAMDRANDAKTDGNLLFKNAQYEDALLKYELALQLAPEIPLSNELCAMCYANRGICYLKLGKYEETIKECTKAIELNPAYIKALLRRAYAYERLECFEDAVGDYKEILELEPSNNEARSNIPRLEPKAREKAEKMKEEMTGKLKEMGNSILGRFGDEHVNPEGVALLEDDELWFRSDVEVLEDDFVVKSNLPEEVDEDDDFDVSKEFHQSFGKAMCTRHDNGVDHEVLDEENFVD
ncbi:hypothetical protein Droror1_Dr00020151 [Drosera rotundifolia]